MLFSGSLKAIKVGVCVPVLVESTLTPVVCLCVGVGHRGDGAEAEEGADRSEPLGSGPGSLSEPPVQRLLPDHQGGRVNSRHHCSAVAIVTGATTEL